MGAYNDRRRAAPDLEKEALSIAAHTLYQEAEELRQELREALRANAVLEAERDKLLRQLQEPSEERDLLSRYRAAEAEAEQYLDYLRATHQLQSFGYWRDRRKQLQLQQSA